MKEEDPLFSFIQHARHLYTDATILSVAVAQPRKYVNGYQDSIEHWKMVELRLKRIIFNRGRLKIRRIKSNADTDVANTDWIINN